MGLNERDQDRIAPRATPRDTGFLATPSFYAVLPPVMATMMNVCIIVCESFSRSLFDATLCLSLDGFNFRLQLAVVIC